MAYLWTDTETIQNYIGNATIEIGDADTDTFSTASAQQHENDAVDEISHLIGIAWSGLETLTPQNAPGVLKRMAARLTAAKIGVSVVGGALGDMPGWCILYRKEVFSHIRRMLLSWKTTELSPLTVRSDVTLQDVMIKGKIREFEEETTD